MFQVYHIFDSFFAPSPQEKTHSCGTTIRFLNKSTNFTSNHETIAMN